MTANELRGLVHAAWAQVPAPPEGDMKMMEWGWGKPAARAFTGVPPMDVDIRSSGFLAATPLLDLPPRAAAAYLGTYLLSLLDSLAFQESTGLFDDFVTRPHTLGCLANGRFWDEVIRQHSPPGGQHAIIAVVRFLVCRRDALALTAEQAERLVELATEAGE